MNKRGGPVCLACLPASVQTGNWKLEHTHAGKKASFLPWWGQKNPAGRVGLGPQGLPVIGSAWAPWRSVPCTNDSRPQRECPCTGTSEPKIVPARPSDDPRTCKPACCLERHIAVLRSGALAYNAHNARMTGKRLNDLSINPGP